MKNKDERQGSLSTAQLLDAVAVPNRAVTVQKRSESELVLTVPLAVKWYMKRPFSFLFPFSTHRKVALDPLGIEVWDACDGVRKTEEIVDRFAQKHKLTFHEARLSVMLFLKQLTKRGLIVMVGAPAQESIQ